MGKKIYFLGLTHKSDEFDDALSYALFLYFNAYSLRESLEEFKHI